MGGERCRRAADGGLEAGVTPPDRDGALSTGAILALAYPERIAKNRGGGTGAFLLANGRGANIDPASPLARAPFLAVAEIVGSAAQGRITLAATIGLADIEARFADRIVTRAEITVDPGTLALRGRRARRLGAIALGEQAVPVVPDESTAAQLAEAIATAGLDRLPWTKALRQWRDRVLFLRAAEGEEWPDLSDAALAASTAEWLAPLFADKTSLAALGADEFDAALHGLLPHTLRRRLEAEAPTHFDAPSGSRVPIEYEAEGPKLAIRVQELFGLDRHPSVARGRVPLVIELLVARAPPGAGDARPPQLLARQLRRRPRRPARPLSPPSLARGPALRPGHPPGEAARAVRQSSETRRDPNVLDQHEQMARVSGRSREAEVLVERRGAVIFSMHGKRPHADNVRDLKRASERVQKQTRSETVALHFGMNRKTREHEQRDRVPRHSLCNARWRLCMLNLAGHDRIVADDVAISDGDVGLRRMRLLGLQRVLNEKAIELGLPASEPFNGVRAAEFFDVQCVHHESFFAIEHRSLAKQALETHVAPRWSIECRDKGIPTLAVERKHPPVGEPGLGLAQCRFEHEFAHGLALGSRSRLQGPLRCAAQPKVKLLGTIRALGHGISLHAHSSNARQCHDNSRTLQTPISANLGIRATDRSSPQAKASVTGPAVNVAHIALCSVPRAIVRNSMRSILVFAAIMLALAAAAPKLIRQYGSSGPTTPRRRRLTAPTRAIRARRRSRAAPTATSRPTPMSTAGAWVS